MKITYQQWLDKMQEEGLSPDIVGLKVNGVLHKVGTKEYTELMNTEYEFELPDNI